jgi:hypothetical protein
MCWQRYLVFGKTAFVKFKISKHFKQNSFETDLKQPKSIPYQHMDFKNLKKKIRAPKVSRLLPVIYNKKSIG